MTYTKIQTRSTHDGAVLRITLNAPKGNILDSVMMTELDQALGSVPDSTKLIIFDSALKHFSFGASVEEHTRDNAPRMLQQFHGLFKTMMDLSVPTLAVVKGQCLGGGMELAIYCTFILAEQNATFGQPEIKLGVFPPPASLILPMKVGQVLADQWCLLGGNVSAPEALEAGLVNLVVPEAEIEDTIETFIADHILPLSASSLRIAHKAVRLRFNKRLKKGLDKLTKLYLDELMDTHDANEGIAAFMERRSPTWQG